MKTHDGFVVPRALLEETGFSPDFPVIFTTEPRPSDVPGEILVVARRVSDGVMAAVSRGVVVEGRVSFVVGNDTYAMEQGVMKDGVECLLIHRAGSGSGEIQH